MPYTLGFETYRALADHFQKHRHEFGVTTIDEYAALADKFCGGPRDADTMECVRRRDSDTLRYNTVSYEYGVLRRDKYIRTYFKLNKRDNLAYFKANCAMV